MPTDSEPLKIAPIHPLDPINNYKETALLDLEEVDLNSDTIKKADYADMQTLNFFDVKNHNPLINVEQQGKLKLEAVQKSKNSKNPNPTTNLDDTLTLHPAQDKNFKPRTYEEVLDSKKNKSTETLVMECMQEGEEINRLRKKNATENIINNQKAQQIDVDEKVKEYTSTSKVFLVLGTIAASWMGAIAPPLKTIFDIAKETCHGMKELTETTIQSNLTKLEHHYQTLAHWISELSQTKHDAQQKESQRITDLDTLLEKLHRVAERIMS